MEIGQDIKWSSVLEGFFKDMGEKAFCYGYLHKKCEAKYSNKRNFIDLPVIVLSTVAGTLSIGNSSIFGEENEKIANMGIGVLSLFVSVLNTVGTYFSFAKRAEAHRQSSIQYQKLYRFLDIELSLPRKERMRPTDMLKTCRDNYERLSEVSPLIPYDILKSFKRRFRKYDVAKPSEANGLEKIDIYKSKSKSKYTCHSDDESDTDSDSDDKDSYKTSSSRLDSSELEEIVVDSPPLFDRKISKRSVLPNQFKKSSLNSLSNITDEEAEKLLSLLRAPSYNHLQKSLPVDYNTTDNIRRSAPYLSEEANRQINVLKTPDVLSTNLSYIANNSLRNVAENLADNAVKNVVENMAENVDRTKSLIGNNLKNSIGDIREGIVIAGEETKETVEKVFNSTTDILNNIVEKNDSNNK